MHSSGGYPNIDHRQPKATDSQTELSRRAGSRVLPGGFRIAWPDHDYRRHTPKGFIVLDCPQAVNIAAIEALREAWEIPTARVILVSRPRRKGSVRQAYLAVSEPIARRAVNKALRAESEAAPRT